jgi:hypothetical protein
MGVHDVFVTVRTPAGFQVTAPAPVPFQAGDSNLIVPHVAALADGGFVVVWNEDFTDKGIRAEVFDANGVPQTGSILVNTTQAGLQLSGDVAALPDGGFIVGWEDAFAGNDKAQRFDAAGNKVGAEFISIDHATFDMNAAALADGRSIFTVDHFSGGNFNEESSIWDSRITDANHATGANFFGSGGGSGDLLIISDHSSSRTADALQIENSNLQTSKLIAMTGMNIAFDGAGDFNHDGLSDLLAHTDLSNGVRNLFAYQMTPVGVGGTNTVANLGQDWIPDAFGDFNGDGTSDILLHRDAAGARTFEVLSMNNYTVQSAPIVQVTGTDWVADGTGDFNHDGTSDILEQRIVGGTMNLQEVALKNNVIQSVSPLANIGADWQIDGTGDFNHNGTSDILMHRDSGNVRTFEILTINNNAIASGTVVAQTGANFKVDGIGDFNHDGTSDIAMHADTGMTRNDWIFSIANNVVANAHIVASTGIDWHVS